MSKQKGFYFDARRCVRCRTCEMACKATHDTEPGVHWRRVTDTWKGVFPDVTRTFFSLACMHCEKPACVSACPTGAIVKSLDDGVVTVIKSKCNGCRECLSACPFGVPQFGRDGIMQKCDFCSSIGRDPACAESCPAEALDFGTMDQLATRAASKSGRRMEGATGPSILIVDQVL